MTDRTQVTNDNWKQIIILKAEYQDYADSMEHKFGVVAELAASLWTRAQGCRYRCYMNVAREI